MTTQTKRGSTKPKTHKKHYRVRNWKQYNEALVRRGSLTVWFSINVLACWMSVDRTGKRGRPFAFSAIAMETMLTLQQLFRLPLRQTEGLLNSVLTLTRTGLQSPDHSTLAKRTPSVRPVIAATLPKDPRHIVIDSTGVKVYGEGEWKVRIHGKSKRRTWRKVHLALDPETGEITAACITDNSVHDSETLASLLDQTRGAISDVGTDGAYDTRDCYDAIAARNAVPVIPPQRNAKIWRHGSRKGAPHPRDVNLRRIRQIGRSAWKVETGYHRRSLAETWRSGIGAPVCRPDQPVTGPYQYTQPHDRNRNAPELRRCITRGNKREPPTCFRELFNNAATSHSSRKCMHTWSGMVFVHSILTAPLIVDILSHRPSTRNASSYGFMHSIFAKEHRAGGRSASYNKHDSLSF